MTQDAEPASEPASRNATAHMCLIAAIVFLVPTVSMLVSNGLALSSWGSQFLKANRDHPAAFFLELVFEVTFLGIPFCFLGSLIVILVGVGGLFASRSRGGAGRKEAITGIGLSVLVLALCVAGFFQWASAWVQ